MIEIQLFQTVSLAWLPRAEYAEQKQLLYVKWKGRSIIRYMSMNIIINEYIYYNEQ